MTTCQECGGDSCELVTGERIYPHRPDLYWKRFWVCKQCPDAYVGCHGSSERPLGTCAGPQLRKVRRQCHAEFDPLWQGEVFRSRTRAYNWLSNKMHKSVHFSQMSMGECEVALRYIRVHYQQLIEEGRKG